MVGGYIIRQCCPRRAVARKINTRAILDRTREDARKSGAYLLYAEKSEVGPFSEKQVEKVAIMHTDACYVVHARKIHRKKVSYLVRPRGKRTCNTFRQLSQTRQENGKKNFSARRSKLVMCYLPMLFLFPYVFISFLTWF